MVDEPNGFPHTLVQPEVAATATAQGSRGRLVRHPSSAHQQQQQQQNSASASRLQRANGHGATIDGQGSDARLQAYKSFHSASSLQGIQHTPGSSTALAVALARQQLQQPQLQVDFADAIGEEYVDTTESYTASSNRQQNGLLS